MLRNHSCSNYRYKNDYQNTSNSYCLTFKSPIRRERSQSNENRYNNDFFISQNPRRINLTKSNYSMRKCYSSRICPKNLFYDSLCGKCYNSKQNQLKREKYELKRENQKEKLNNSMTSVNPNIFKDEMLAYEKLNIKNKVRNRQLLTKKVFSILQNYINKNPTEKEKYQNKSSYSLNSLKLGTNDLRYERIIKKYDMIQNNIQKNVNKYNFDIPRKEIRDYYSKCIYDVPQMEPYNITPQDVQKNLCSYLKKQIKDKEELKKKEKENERKNHLKSIEFNDYNINYNNNIETEEIKELFNDNQQILYYKNKMRKNKEKETKYYENKLRDRMKKENENDYYKKINKKKNDIENFKNWLQQALEEKKRRKKIEDEENKKWNQFQNDLYNNYNKCLHNCDIEKCSYCNHIIPQEEIYHVYKNRNRYKRNGSNMYKFNGML